MPNYVITVQGEDSEGHSTEMVFKTTKPAMAKGLAQGAKDNGYECDVVQTVEEKAVNFKLK